MPWPMLGALLLSVSPGDPATIQAPVVWQAPVHSIASAQDLRGNVVVLEFWATWCAPCIDVLPHLNDLVEKFKGRPVRFLSITDEPEETVRSFLDIKLVAGWIGFDRQRVMAKAYEVWGIPHTILIDAQGKVAAVTYPRYVTAEVLEKMLAGKPPEVRQRAALPSRAAASSTDTPALVELVIRPSTTGSLSTESRPGRFEATGMTLRAAFSRAHRFPGSRIIGDGVAGQIRYDITVAVPPERRESLEPLLQDGLAATLGLTARRERREMEALVLTAPSERPKGLRQPASSSGSSSRWGRGKLSAVNRPLSALVTMLEDALERPVVDETRLTGNFDFEASWDPDQSDGVLRAIREQLGLEVKTDKRSIEVLVVEARR